MPSIDWNRRKWDVNYHWNADGDLWSRGYGGPAMQWRLSLLPRILPFVPAGSILEIAPGFGRWTQFLKDLCERLTVIDLSQKCIDSCKKRFEDCSSITYHQNDGRSLAMIPDDSIDFVFSIDSLVHAEEDVIAAYLEQLHAKMTPDGVGFIHHSNLGEHARLYTFMRSNTVVYAICKGLGLGPRGGDRALSMTAAKFAACAEAAGLQCIAQEIVNWGRRRRLIDCFSLFTRRGSRWERPNVVVRNPSFRRERRRIIRLSSLYGDF